MDIYQTVTALISWVGPNLRFCIDCKTIKPGKSLGKDGGDTNILIKYLPQLVKEYNFWMRGSDRLDEKNNSIYRVALMPDKSILNHYWDESDTPRPESYKEDVELAKKQVTKPGYTGTSVQPVNPAGTFLPAGLKLRMIFHPFTPQKLFR